ncbi:MAG: radical SAM protein [Candidatus Portnoybacteria bacterium]|nr:radical SAM protein [Candidatus Portnoybacteria bacterium]
MIFSTNKLRWSCYGRVDTVNERILRAIKKAGCVQVEYGIEAGSPRVLEMIKKNTNIEGIKKAIRLTKEIGLRALGSFIFGFANDTEQDFKESIELAEELDLDFAVAFFATPYPASEIYDKAMAENRIIEPDMSKWYMRNNNIWRVDLDKEIIKRWRDEFMKRVRWSNLKFFLKKPSLLFNVSLLMLKNIGAVYKAAKESIKMRSFDDFGYYFYVYLAQNLKNRNVINL